MEELKDIKPNIEIVNSGFVDTIFIVAVIVIVLLIFFFIYKLLRKNKKIDKRKASVLYLKGLDFNMDDKQLAYEFTKHGYITVEEHFYDEFIKILKQLEPFKYKQNIPKIDAELKEQIKDYIKVRVR
jgi:hypothetical protein